MSIAAKKGTQNPHLNIYGCPALRTLVCVCDLTHYLPQTILQVVDKIPTIATQLKIIAAVKATRQGGDG